MKSDSGPSEAATVVQRLAALKRDGGSVLVVGAPRRAHDDLCGRFLHSGGRSVVVCTDGDPDAASRDDSTRVLERPVATRSSAATSPTDATNLRAVTDDLEAAMSAEADGEHPTQVCLDSLLPFLDVTDRPALCSALSSVRERAVDSGAIVHVHLPALPGTVPEDLYERADAVVEVQRQREGSFQRWRLPERGPVTDWVPI